MKKFLLFGAAAMLACAANAQLTEVWAHDMAAVGGNVRNIAVVGNEIAVADFFAEGFTTGPGKVEFYDANGKTTKEFDVDSWLVAEGKGVTGDDGVFSAYHMGRGIAVDCAGNIIVNVAFPNAPSATNFVVIAPDGTMSYLECVVPTPGVAARADFFDVTGDIFGNAFIGLTPNTANYAVIYNVYEGAQDADYSYLVYADEGTSFSNETKVCWAKKTFSEDAEKAPEFYVYNRSVGGVRYSDGTSATAMVNMGENFAQGKATSTGATAFEVNGTTYIVMPTPDAAGARASAFKVINVATGEVAAETQGDLTFGTAYTQDFGASVNADGTVNIAQLVQGKYLSMWKFTPGASAIDEIAADNAAVEYYNLQGVKVANPENGIFVKKQGAKATKVVL